MGGPVKRMETVIVQLNIENLLIIVEVDENRTRAQGNELSH